MEHGQGRLKRKESKKSIMSTVAAGEDSPGREEHTTVD